MEIKKELHPYDKVFLNRKVAKKRSFTKILGDIILNHNEQR